MTQKKIISIMGPTATGKTRLAIELTAKLPCEIVSVDSAKIYRDMNIGTAKPGQDILQSYKHHLIDIIAPTDIYSVADFLKDIKLQVENIIQRGNIPLLVGGTTMYFHALKNGLSMLPEADEVVRAYINKVALSKGWAFVYDRLINFMPELKAAIKINDRQRIQRALEIYYLTGLTSNKLPIQKKFSNYDFIEFSYLPQDRIQLRKNISSRLEQMLKMGFVDEVRSLWSKYSLNYNLPSMKSVGYRQISHYVHNHYSYTEMVDKSLIATNQLAKRQMTWLRSWKSLVVLPENYSAAVDVILSKCKF